MCLTAAGAGLLVLWHGGNRRWTDELWNLLSAGTQHIKQAEKLQACSPREAAA